METNYKLSFIESLKKLGIEDFEERIFYSNSKGELFHCYDYIDIAKNINEQKKGAFRQWFLAVIEFAEKNWERPESVFQHISRFLSEELNQNKP